MGPENRRIGFIPDLSFEVGEIGNPDPLGQFEQLVLMAILAMREVAYGVTIHSEVQKLARLRRSVKLHRYEHAVHFPAYRS